MPGIVMVGDATMLEYHDCVVKIDIAMANTSISNIVTTIITSWYRSLVRSTRGGDVTMKWKK